VSAEKNDRSAVGSLAVYIENKQEKTIRWIGVSKDIKKKKNLKKWMPISL
jgi:hypothetical protein